MIVVVIFLRVGSAWSFFFHTCRNDLWRRVCKM